MVGLRLGLLSLLGSSLLGGSLGRLRLTGLSGRRLTGLSRLGLRLGLLGGVLSRLSLRQLLGGLPSLLGGVFQCPLGGRGALGGLGLLSSLGGLGKIFGPLPDFLSFLGNLLLHQSEGLLEVAGLNRRQLPGYHLLLLSELVQLLPGRFGGQGRGLLRSPRRGVSGILTRRGSRLVLGHLLTGFLWLRLRLARLSLWLRLT